MRMIRVGTREDVAIHDGGGGKPLTDRELDNLEQDYQSLGVKWDDLPNAYHAILKGMGLSSRNQYGANGHTGSQEGGLGEPALWAAAVFAGWRIGGIALEILGYGCTNDGNCTNEFESSMPLAQNSISWLSGQNESCRTHFSPKHASDRLTTLSGDLAQDYKAIQPFIAQTIESGVSKGN